MAELLYAPSGIMSVHATKDFQYKQKIPDVPEPTKEGPRTRTYKRRAPKVVQQAAETDLYDVGDTFDVSGKISLNKSSDPKNTTNESLDEISPDKSTPGKEEKIKKTRKKRISKAEKNLEETKSPKNPDEQEYHASTPSASIQKRERKPRLGIKKLQDKLEKYSSCLLTIKKSPIINEINQQEYELASQEKQLSTQSAQSITSASNQAPIKIPGALPISNEHSLVMSCDNENLSDSKIAQVQSQTAGPSFDAELDVESPNDSLHLTQPQHLETIPEVDSSVYKITKAKDLARYNKRSSKAIVKTNTKIKMVQDLSCTLQELSALSSELRKDISTLSNIPNLSSTIPNITKLPQISQLHQNYFSQFNMANFGNLGAKLECKQLSEPVADKKVTSTNASQLSNQEHNQPQKRKRGRPKKSEKPTAVKADSKQLSTTPMVAVPTSLQSIAQSLKSLNVSSQNGSLQNQDQMLPKSKALLANIELLKEKYIQQ